MKSSIFVGMHAVEKISDSEYMSSTNYGFRNI